MNAEEIRNQDFDHKHCQAGCKVFSYGEIKHHQDCVYYEDSLSQSYDEKSIRIKQLEEVLGKQVGDIKRKSKLEELNDLKTYAGFMSDMSSKTYLYSRILERIKKLNNDQEPITKEK